MFTKQYPEQELKAQVMSLDTILRQMQKYKGTQEVYEYLDTSFNEKVESFKRRHGENSHYVRLKHEYNRIIGVEAS